MSTVTIGTAGSTFANLAAWEVNLAGSGGLKENAIGLLHNIGSAHPGNTFTGIGTSAFRVILKPATGAAFWDHVSAESNRLWFDQTFGASVSGDPALSFTDMIVTVSGILANSSGAPKTLEINENTTLAGGDQLVNNCILELRYGVGGCIGGNAINYPLRVTNTVLISHRANGCTQDYAYSSAYFTNCTFLNTSAQSNVRAIRGNFDPMRFENCLFINFSLSDNDSALASVRGGHNVTTRTSAQSYIAAGTSALGSATPVFAGATGSTEIFAVNSAAYDARLLKNAVFALNNACAATTPAVDILNRTRVSPHDVGAWDASAAISAGGGGGGGAVRRTYVYNPLGNLTVDFRRIG